MDYRILYTEPALADLRDLMRWSWENHPETSARFGNAILDHISLLASHPRIGAMAPGREGVRRILFRPVRIYYRIDEAGKTVEIIRILHASRRENRI